MAWNAESTDWTEVVRELSTIHAERTGREPAPLAAPASASGRSQKRAQLQHELVERLRGIHESRTASVRARPSRTAPDVYDRVRELFRKREDDLRKESNVVDGILAKIRSGAGVEGPSGPLQQDLRVVCPAGGASRGRFLVANETERAVEVVFVPGRLRGGQPSWVETIALGFTLDAPKVAPGIAVEAEVAIDLERSPVPAGSRLELPVDLLAESVRLGRLWLEIVVPEVES